MSRIIGRLPSSTLLDNDDCEDEDGSVFADETISVFPSSFELIPRKCTKTSISRNSARLKSINLNEHVKSEQKKEKDGISLPIRRKDARIIQNPFQKYRVPDEVVDVIFSNLRKRDLLSVMRVCKQFYAVGHESKRWAITDVMDRPITELTLVTLMRRRIKVLRLAGAKLDTTLPVDPRFFSACMLSTSRLECLDLSRSNLSQRQLAIVLKPCRKLQFLSLEGNILDNHVAGYVSENKNLRQLDISMTHGITMDGARMIFDKCKNLEQLNASWCGLDRPILGVLLDRITDKIRKINLAGSVRNFGLCNEHIDLLSSKVPDLVDIDISDNVEISDAAVATLISRFPKLIFISLNRCYGVDPNIIVHLNGKPSLTYLNVHGCITDNNMEMFFQMCDRLKINSQVFNYTAKPTIGSASKVWGYDMREY
ncbi:CBN-SKPT-1 protein [Caenorhabditis brenneri]|uniref:CBN-SKPT-1 protein n=1 Tax=Caenorhabditis brenneri TaxID=135651 RepID=G0MPQ2_CAEBE|nr:CBN-SKPT-1 protein [Caenorhabditis brenneri]